MTVGETPALIEARLRALARAGAGVELTAVDPGIGAGVGFDATTQTGFYVTDEPRAVGKAIQWAAARGLARIEILALSHGADLARRAGLVSVAQGDAPAEPQVGVWTVSGASVAPAEPGPAAAPPPLPSDVWALAGVISEAGARPVDDHGRLVAEVAGLEVARVVTGAAIPTIDVGVGQADRELNQAIHQGLDADAALRRVISAVAEHRNHRSHHPLARLARARWLRSRLLDDPSLVGATDLQPVPPLRRREAVTGSDPVAAIGSLASGRAVVVVTAAGVDLDLVPEAADYRQRHDPAAELLLVTTAPDLRLNTTLLPRVDEARALSIDPPWSPSSRTGQ